jgi:hypothetical protein
VNIQQFKVWVRRKLGQDDDCGVKVELTDKMIDQALDDAKEWFNAFVGLHKEATLTMIGEQGEYDLAAVTPRIESIVKVWFPRRATEIDFSVLYPGFLDVEGIPYGVGTLWGAGYPQTTIVQTLQTLESNAKFLSVDLDWEFYADNTTDPDTRLLRIMPPPKDAGTAVYLYRIDPRDIKLEHYDQRHLWFLREWALAEAKYTLGRIRGKYTSGLPAAGGERTLDGDSLISEAREDKERLEEKILELQGPVMPMLY